MQDIMEGKVARVFMNILRSKNHRSLWLILPLLAGWNCSPDLSDDQIPYQPFPDIIFNLNLPENIAMKSKGIAREINGGVRGIILYCQEVGVYYAYERNCSYHPNEACATINIDNSLLFMSDPCCGSTFDFSTGNPIGGVAWRPLQRYKATYTGSDVIITDEVVR